MIKKIFFVLAIFFFSNTLFAQRLNGRIIDLSSEDPVIYANIYLEGTTIGTVSDGNGNFSLDIRNYNGIPIIVSTIGYKSRRITEYPVNQNLCIGLEKAEYTLTVTEVKAKKLNRAARARYLAEFKREFLGVSGNAYRCEILNEKDLIYDYDKASKTLFVNSKKPLKIKNNALGYEVTYHLDNFISAREFVFYDGYYFFTEIESKSQLEVEKIEDNRYSAYLGSRLALIRSIYDKNLKNNLFTLYDTNYTEIKLKKIIDELPSGDKIFCPGQELIIHFGFNQFPIKSRLIPIDSCIRITKEGYFNANSIKWGDRISIDRVADLLPFEYKLSEKQKTAFEFMKKL